ncbi:baseplate protein [Xenorhabdus mauleonii]|uniref:Baseplate protein n=1 Tax=Xenorhabdus mauleonii TaxID=351675 RepID=A0A1I3SIM7_9GAMM|nr:baseplate protein [Xenorhabdus mauleonii]SFJ58574.1 hypothetical protein SAMN05421680_111128 [Xenorhabdus mauleonii]
MLYSPAHLSPIWQEAGDVFHHPTGNFFLNVGGKTTIKSQGEITFESASGFKAKAPEFGFSQ